MIKHMANIVTGCRILGSVLLFLFPVCSAGFYTIYMLCGLSDMIDGAIARKTNSACQLGAKLDTVADLILVIVSSMKLLPTITLPPWVWIWGTAIAMIKIGSIAWGYVSKKRFISLHTMLNKITGLLLFLWPLTWSFAEIKYSAVILCCIATFTSIQDGFHILKGES